MASHIETVSNPNRLKSLWTSARRFAARLAPSSRAWRGATWGVVLAAALLWTVMSAYAFAPAGPLAFVLGLLGGLLAGALLGGIVMLVGALLRLVPRRHGWAWKTGAGTLAARLHDSLVILACTWQALYFNLIPFRL